MLLLSEQENPVSAGRDAWPVDDNDMCTLAEFYQTQFQSEKIQETIEHKNPEFDHIDVLSNQELINNSDNSSILKENNDENK